MTWNLRKSIQHEMNSDLLYILSYWERQKGIKREMLIEALEKALVPVLRRRFGPFRKLRADVDPITGDIRAFSSRLVVNNLANQYDEISIAEASEVRTGARLGDEIETEITPSEFGRVASTHARQILEKVLVSRSDESQTP